MDAAQRKVRAVAQMHTLKHTGRHWTAVANLLWFCKRNDAAICNIAAFYQPYSLQLRQGCQLCDRVIREVRATRQVNIADAVAQLDKLDDTCIGDTRAVTQMDVVQILSEPCDGQYSAVCDIAAFIEDQVPQAWCRLHDLLNPGILQLCAVGKVEDAESVVCCSLRET